MPTWVGDVVMATPVLSAIAHRFPDAHLALLTHKHLQDVVEGMPWAQHIHLWAGKPKDRTSRQAYRAWLQDLKQEAYDTIILLPNSLRVAWFAWRMGARHRIGYDRDGRGLLLTHALPVPNRTKGGYEPLPLVEYYANLAANLGCPPPGDQLQLAANEADEEALTQRLEAEGVAPDATLVVLCPGANFGASKCWHPERFAAVADNLVRHHNATIVISPGPGEEPLAQAIVQSMQADAVLLDAPCITLGELKSLIKRSALLLGNDTGPRHFARAFDTPRVTIFGPTEARWTDTSHDRETIVRVDVPCGPCHKKVCPLAERVCMDDVTIPMVTQACELQFESLKLSPAETHR